MMYNSAFLFIFVAILTFSFQLYDFILTNILIFTPILQFCIHKSRAAYN